MCSNAPGEDADDTAVLNDARKDRLCPPGRNPDNPVVLVAAGDSVTSSHLMLSYSMKCNADNTSADDRHLPGNDMKFSYAGKYTFNINKNVVEYYNFARTGFGTHEMLFADPGHRDACGDQWARNSPPVDLAVRAIEQAKTEKKAAYFVATGGVNNTNWTDVLAGVAKCGTIDYYSSLVQQWVTAHGLTWKPVVRYYDTVGKPIAKEAVINGGSCQIRVESPTKAVRFLHVRVRIDPYDGPSHFQDIQNDVGDIANQVLAAGADKVVWMAYYNISPARWDVGDFAETYRQEMSQLLNNYLPGRIPSQERDLIDNDGWKQTVGQWTTQINQQIQAGLPAADNVRLMPAPVLQSGQLQKIALGGVPHPNEPGQTMLSEALNTAFGG